MDKPYDEFTDADWAEHFARKKRDLEELKAFFHIKPHFDERSMLPSFLFFSFVWWRGKMLHLCFVIQYHVWELYWLGRDRWKTTLKHRDWREWGLEDD